MSLPKRYPVGALLVSRYVTGDLLFFRVIGHTKQKVRVNQIKSSRMKINHNYTPTYLTTKNSRLINSED